MTGSARSRPRDILVVEDVDAMRGLLSHLLDELPGFRLSGAVRNSWEARLELTRRRPDLVLLDEVLPGESSLDLLRELRGQGIPVILVTGIESPTHSLPSEASARLAKPSWDTLEWDRERFRTAMEAALAGG